MATQAQGTSLMPLQGELQLVNYINSLFGGDAGYTAQQVTNPSLVSELSATDLQNLMTEYLRGQGNFLEQGRQQNLSGLFNTSTRNLVSNDIMAQAALKATQANTAIKNTNAQILADVAKTNATLANQAMLAKLQAGLPGKTGAGTLAAAAGISGLGSFLEKSGLGSALNTGLDALSKSFFGNLFGGGTGTTKKGTKTDGTSDTGMDEATDLMASIGTWNEGDYANSQFDPTALLEAYDAYQTPVQATELSGVNDYALSQFADLMSGVGTNFDLASYDFEAPSYNFADTSSMFGNYDMSNWGIPTGGWDWGNNIASNFSDDYLTVDTGDFNLPSMWG